MLFKINYWLEITDSGQQNMKADTRKKKWSKQSLKRIWRKELYNNQAHTNTKIMIAPFLSRLENILFNELYTDTYMHEHGSKGIIHSIHARLLCRPSLSFRCVHTFNRAISSDFFFVNGQKPVYIFFLCYFNPMINDG